MVAGLARLGARRKLLVLSGVVLIVVAALLFSQLRPGSPKKPDPVVAQPGPGDRVLQSVDLAMRTDGSLTGVQDTAVIARSQSGDADTVSSTYDPVKVVDNLPVRVLTSYRTEHGAGTDLADLKGYTGRVRIDLTVENLTVHAQQLHYDVAGQSRTSTAMVGAPLTVVASAALPGTSPAKVVTDSSDTAANAETTNGVLSQSQDNTTQVQWATILAPPQLDASATLRLVVDAKDFALPAIDLSVQPGLVTDPSLGALVDAAFAPKNSAELALETRTIKVIGDVNGVLGRASDTITKVRGTLDSTSKTLGTKTVSALRSSTANVTSSMKTSHDALKALDQDLSSSLKSTNSATLARMADTVSQLNQLLGDTTAKAPTPTVTGSGCEQQVKAPGKSQSVYGSLLAVSAQLNGYAAATQACKVLLQKTVVDSIGPAEPSAQACPEASAAASVTCSLFGLESTFVAIAERFVQDSHQALAGLDPGSLDPVNASIGDLLTQLGDVDDATETLLAPDPTAATRQTLAEISHSLSDAGDSLTALTKAVDGVHDDAADESAKAKSLLAQNADLADQLCDLVGTSTEPGKLTDAKVEQLRSYLSSRSCADPDGHTTELTPPAKYGASMQSRLSDQGAAFAKIAAETDTSDPSQGAGLPLSQLRSRISALSSQVEEASSSLDQGTKVLTAKVAALRTSVHQAERGLQDLRGDVGGVKSSYAAVKTQLDAALQQAGVDATANATQNFDPEIRRIATQGQADSKQLGEMLERSAAGLTAAADTIQSDGATTVKKQQEALSQSQAEAGKSLSAGTDQALSQVSHDVSAATRDLDATKTLLTGDLANVLLDLGTRKTRGSGVLGALATGASAADSADYQLALASDKGSAYAAVRAQDLGGIMLRQAQAEAALERQADLPAFVRELPATVSHRTVYIFHLGGDG